MFRGIAEGEIMSISAIQTITAPVAQSTAKISSGSADNSFASELTSAQNETGYSDAEVKRFFARNPGKQEIADKAVALGLNESQIAQAMQIGGAAGGKSMVDLKTAIENFVATANGGYSWGSDGALVSTKATAKQAAAVHNQGLEQTAAQMVQAEVADKGMNMGQVSSAVLETMYVDAAHKLGVDIGPQGAWNSYFSPTLGRAVGASEIQAFF